MWFSGWFYHVLCGFQVGFIMFYVVFRLVLSCSMWFSGWFYHVLCGFQVGFIMFYVRSPAEGGQEAIGEALSVCFVAGKIT